MADQSFSTHTRFHPWFHFFAFPVIVINFLVSLYMIYRAPGAMPVWNAVVAAALVVIALLTRFYGLRNQDRIIRLEERVRMQSLLPDDLRARIPELHMSDLIALRFCSDAELPEAVRAVLAGEAKGRKEIKQRVKQWRPDYHRL